MATDTKTWQYEVQYYFIPILTLVSTILTAIAGSGQVETTKWQYTLASSVITALSGAIGSFLGDQGKKNSNTKLAKQVAETIYGKTALESSRLTAIEKSNMLEVSAAVLAEFKKTSAGFLDEDFYRKWQTGVVVVLTAIGSLLSALAQNLNNNTLSLISTFFNAAVTAISPLLQGNASAGAKVGKTSLKLNGQKVKLLAANVEGKAVPDVEHAARAAPPAAEERVQES